MISDLFVVAACAWVLYFCAKRQGYPLAVLWGWFFASVGLAAWFGVLRFAEVHPSMIHVAQFFQKIASTLGSTGLLAGVFWLFTRYPSLPLLTWSALLGAICLLVGFWVAPPAYFSILQIVAMLAVLLLAALFWFLSPTPETRTLALRLFLAIILSALATTALRTIPEPYSIDLFHYLLAAAMLSFAWAASARKAHVSVVQGR